MRPGSMKRTNIPSTYDEEIGDDREYNNHESNSLLDRIDGIINFLGETNKSPYFWANEISKKCTSKHMSLQKEPRKYSNNFLAKDLMNWEMSTIKDKENSILVKKEKGSSSFNEEKYQSLGNLMVEAFDSVVKEVDSKFNENSIMSKAINSQVDKLIIEYNRQIDQNGSNIDTERLLNFKFKSNPRRTTSPNNNWSETCNEVSENNNEYKKNDINDESNCNIYSSMWDPQKRDKVIKWISGIVKDLKHLIDKIPEKERGFLLLNIKHQLALSQGSSLVTEKEDLLANLNQENDETSNFNNTYTWNNLFDTQKSMPSHILITSFNDNQSSSQNITNNGATNNMNNNILSSISKRVTTTVEMYKPANTGNNNQKHSDSSYVFTDEDDMSKIETANLKKDHQYQMKCVRDQLDLTPVDSASLPKKHTPDLHLSMGYMKDSRTNNYTELPYTPGDYDKPLMQTIEVPKRCEPYDRLANTLSSLNNYSKEVGLANFKKKKASEVNWAYLIGDGSEKAKPSILHSKNKESEELDFIKYVDESRGDNCEGSSLSRIDVKAMNYEVQVASKFNSTGNNSWGTDIVYCGAKDDTINSNERRFLESKYRNYYDQCWTEKIGGYDVQFDEDDEELSSRYFTFKPTQDDESVGNYWNIVSWSNTGNGGNMYSASTNSSGGNLNIVRNNVGNNASMTNDCHFNNGVASSSWSHGWQLIAGCNGALRTIEEENNEDNSTLSRDRERALQKSNNGSFNWNITINSNNLLIEPLSLSWSNRMMNFSKRLEDELVEHNGQSKDQSLDNSYYNNNPSPNFLHLSDSKTSNRKSMMTVSEIFDYSNQRLNEKDSFWYDSNFESENQGIFNVNCFRQSMHLNWDYFETSKENASKRETTLTRVSKLSLEPENNVQNINKKASCTMTKFANSIGKKIEKENVEEKFLLQRNEARNKCLSPSTAKKNRNIMSTRSGFSIGENSPFSSSQKKKTKTCSYLRR